MSRHKTSGAAISRSTRMFCSVREEAGPVLVIINVGAFVIRIGWGFLITMLVDYPQTPSLIMMASTLFILSRGPGLFVDVCGREDHKSLVR